VESERLPDDDVLARTRAAGLEVQKEHLQLLREVPEAHETVVAPLQALDLSGVYPAVTPDPRWENGGAV
jgi:hypothetical protein